MCHHRVDLGEKYGIDERNRADEPTEETEESEEPAVDVELDREFDDSDVKTPGDD